MRRSSQPHSVRARRDGRAPGGPRRTADSDARHGRGIEALVQRRQVVDDALQQHLVALDDVATAGAVPLEGVLLALRALVLCHKTEAAGFRPLRRMQDMRRLQEHVAFAQVDPLVAVALPQQQIGVALELVEEFLHRVVMEVAAAVRPADHCDHEVGLLPDLLVAHGGRSL